MKAFMASRIRKRRIGETEKGRHKKKVKARRSSKLIAQSEKKSKEEVQGNSI
jgi:hypothetical protein